MRPDDYEACAEIYRLNEPGRFPPGYFDLFSESIRGEQNLYLVAEAADAVYGLAGVGIRDSLRLAKYAVFNFGMVHPGFHRQGFGTALLFARIALLPKSNDQWVVYLSTAGGSESFYRRFGFAPVEGFTDEFGGEFDRYRVRLHLQDWQRCRSTIEASSVLFDSSDVDVPCLKVA